MDPSSAPIADQIIESVKTGKAALATAFGECFEGEFGIEIGELRALTFEELRAEWDKKGLSFEHRLGPVALYGLLPTEAAFLPDAFREDPKVELQTVSVLAEQLQKSLPNSASAVAASPQLVERLCDSVPKPTGDGEFQSLSLLITRGEEVGELALVWQPSESAESPNDEGVPNVQDASASANAPAGDKTTAGSPKPLKYADLEEGLQQLPPYAKSLLKIQLPVRVALAKSKLPLQRILELGPGSIIKFEKSCEDTLMLEVGDHEIAEGEAVKVGDKFGLWITAIAMPDERFWVLKGGSPERAK